MNDHFLLSSMNLYSGCLSTMFGTNHSVNQSIKTGLFGAIIMSCTNQRLRFKRTYFKQSVFLVNMLCHDAAAVDTNVKFISIYCCVLSTPATMTGTS